MGEVLRGKVAVITGAASGQGEAAARMFVEEGARVAVVDLNEEGARAVAESIGRDQAIAFGCDVSDADSFRAAVDGTVSRFGQLDILYNNAGLVFRNSAPTDRPEDTGVVDLEEEIFDRTLAVNLKSVYLGSKFAIPHMRRTGAGSIVNVASLSGALLGSSNHAYAASKAGVVGLTRSVALTYGPDNIRCNVICPGLIPTPLVSFVTSSADRIGAYAAAPLGRLGSVDEIAKVALFLASDASSFMTGATVTADGGFTLN